MFTEVSFVRFTEVAFIRKSKIPESEYTYPSFYTRLFYAFLFNSLVPVSFTPLANLHDLLLYVLSFSV